MTFLSTGQSFLKLWTGHLLKHRALLSEGLRRLSLFSECSMILSKVRVQKNPNEREGESRESEGGREESKRRVGGPTKGKD